MDGPTSSDRSARALADGAAAPPPPEPARAEVPGAADAGPEGEAQLWRGYRSGEDASAYAALAERYVPYAKRLAARLYARHGRDEIGLDEYQQLAMVGLLEAIPRYVPGRGALFTTFAAARIQGAILNGLERLTERRQQLAVRRRLLAERTASLVPRPLPLEATEGMLRDLGDVGVHVALGFILEATGMDAARAEGLPNDAYAQIELRQVQQQLWALVTRLPDREREVVEMHYRRGMRFEEIARTLRLSKGRVSQLHRQAVTRLRALASKAENCDIAY
jgi:RNA polymerase sigma factor for flagellar operon FliA